MYVSELCFTSKQFNNPPLYVHSSVYKWESDTVYMYDKNKGVLHTHASFKATPGDHGGIKLVTGGLASLPLPGPMHA